MEIFQKYKKVGIYNYVETIRKLKGLPIIVVGPINVGKKTIVREAFPEIKISNDVSTITETVNGYFYNSICITNIDNMKQSDLEKLSCYIERYAQYMNIICTSRSHNIYHKILDRSFKICVTLPKIEDISHNIYPIMKNEGIVYDIANFEYKTYHNILIELTLLKHNKNVSLLYDYDNYIEAMCNTLNKLDFSEIRTRLYKLFLIQIPMSYVIKKSCDFLVKTHKNLNHFIVITAAECEARIRKGNKDVYHAEAFLFSIKKRI